jgi:hypothetical protein
MVYGVGYDGVYAFDQRNGSIVWHFRAGNSGFETPYGTWAFFETPLVADGKIYAATGEHHISTPTYRGQKLYCLNAWTGEPTWSIMGYYKPTAIAEGILFATNAYDGCSYAFGKGETATTVSVQPAVCAIGGSVLITGSVIDLSPAQPNTPAVSDESMSAWMEYLHMQQPFPGNATGVKVHLIALDPNGITQDIGYVTTDLNGSFKAMWTPRAVEGAYTICAIFEGSNSYYGSRAQTYIGVISAPNVSSVAPKPEVAPSIDVYIVATAAVVIAIFVAVAAVFLRKRK